MTDKYGKIHTDGSRSGGQPVVATQKAHTAMLEVLAEWGIEPRSATPRQLTVATTEALCRAIEQHEDFKREVGDAVEAYLKWSDECLLARWDGFDRFIIPKPKPDPLFGVLWDLGMAEDRAGIEFMANGINDALKARGLEIREKGQ